MYSRTRMHTHSGEIKKVREEEGGKTEKGRGSGLEKREMEDGGNGGTVKEKKGWGREGRGEGSEGAGAVEGGREGSRRG